MSKERKLIYYAVLISFLLTSVLWLVMWMEFAFSVDFGSYGIRPRQLSGLPGIIFSPLIHGDINHLISNSAAFFVLTFVTISSYPKVSMKVLAWLVLLTGIGVWLAGRPSSHIGASGIVYGLVAFLFFMGIFRKDRISIAISLFVTFAYGGLIWGVLPHTPSISWEGHLFGGFAGIICAILYYKVDIPLKQQELIDDEEETDLPYWKYEVEGELKHPDPEEANIRYLFIPKKRTKDD